MGFSGISRFFRKRVQQEFSYGETHISRSLCSYEMRRGFSYGLHCSNKKSQKGELTMAMNALETAANVVEVKLEAAKGAFA